MDTRRITAAFACSVGLSVVLFAAAQDADPPRGRTASCVTSDCHAEVLGASVLHAPVARLKCDACHAEMDAENHLFSLTAPAQELCTTCHVMRHRTFVHDPVGTGECAGCHDPHGSDHRFHLRADPAGDLCFVCHDEQAYRGRPHVHGPVRAGACIACHDVHSSWNANLLAVPGDQLCQSCHEEVNQEQVFARHVHPPVRDGHCVACHDAHASDHVFQLREQPDRLCASCHEHASLFEHIETAARRHGALDAETGCLACHDGHASLMPALLVSPPLDLCLSCHNTSLVTPEGRSLTNMADLLAQNPDHHGPIRRADCSACHDPHAAANSNLLEKHYPPMFYAPFDLKTYELCFSCHLTELATEERGTEVTGFRDGARNLHYLHVNKKERGRTCRTCHEVHASQRAFHIREEVPFGESDWMIEINFEPRLDGGHCAPGCHEEQSYTRGAIPVAAAADSNGDAP